MAKVTPAKQEIAKSKYAQKVCVDYLGIDAEYCERLFDKLIENMKAGIMAVGKE